MSQPSRIQLLVTGASGFLGRAVVARAQAQGLSAIRVTRDMVEQSNPQDMAGLINHHRPTHAIDAAGVVPGRGDVADNVALTKGWLGALELADVAPRLVLVGSAAVYGSGSARDRATREDDPKRPVSDYGRAKHEALSLACMAHKDRGSDVQTGIVFNLMGAGQPDHLAPQVFINNALDAKRGRFEVGSSTAVRDFLDVEDAADALIAMALRGHAGDVLNVASGRATGIADLLDDLQERLGARWYSSDMQARAGEIDICYGNPAKLEQRTGWRPRYGFDHALTRAIDATMSARETKRGT